MKVGTAFTGTETSCLIEPPSNFCNSERSSRSRQKLARWSSEAAMAAFAPDEAVGWYRRALSAMPADADRGERCALEIRLGEAERRIDDTAFLARLMDAAAEARALGRDDLLIGAALARYRGFQISGAEVDPEQIGLLQDALTAAGDEDSPARARLMAAIAAERRFSGDPAYVEGSRDAIAIARRTSDLETLVDLGAELEVGELLDERVGVGSGVERLDRHELTAAGGDGGQAQDSSAAKGRRRRS